MKKKTYKVNRQYRTHEYSKVDGGVTVVVEYKDKTKSAREYTDVKNPAAFIKAIYRNDVNGEVDKAYVLPDNKEDKQ